MNYEPRAADWPLLLAPPDSLRHYAYKLDGRLGMAGPVAQQVAVDEKAMSAPFIISHEAIDRGGDEVVQTGCVLDEYALNPIVLLGHRQSMPGGPISHPIGLSEPKGGPLSVRIVPGSRTEAVCYFHQDTPDALAAFVGVKNGWLRGASIGFDPITPPIPLAPVEGRLRGGHRFEKWRLLEWSIVSVPMHQYCVSIRRCLELGKIEDVRLDQITPTFRKSLELMAEPASAWASGWPGGAPDPLWKADFREDEHPRADDGKFGSGGGGKKPAKKPTAKPAKAPKEKPKRPDVAETEESIRGWLKSGDRPTPEIVRSLSQRLMGLTVVQMHDLKRRLGLKASGRKQELATKIASRALAIGSVKAESVQASREGKPPDKPASDSVAESEAPTTHGNPAFATESSAAKVAAVLPSPGEFKDIVRDAFGDASQLGRGDTWKARAVAGRWEALCDSVAPLLQEYLAGKGIETRAVWGWHQFGPGKMDRDAHVWLETNDGVVIDGALSQYHKDIEPGQIRVHPSRPDAYSEDAGQGPHTKGWERQGSDAKDLDSEVVFLAVMTILENAESGDEAELATEELMAMLSPGEKGEAKSLRLKGEFREEDHPRAEDGKFGSGGGSGGGSGEASSASEGGESRRERANSSKERIALMTTAVHDHAKKAGELEEKLTELYWEDPDVAKVHDALFESGKDERVVPSLLYSNPELARRFGAVYKKSLADRKGDFKKLERACTRALERYSSDDDLGEKSEEDRGKVKQALRAIRLHARRGLEQIEAIRKARREHRDSQKAARDWIAKAAAPLAVGLTCVIQMLQRRFIMSETNPTLLTKAGFPPPTDDAAAEQQQPPPAPGAGGETADVVSAISGLSAAVAQLVAMVQPAPDPQMQPGMGQAPPGSPGADVNGGGTENRFGEEEEEMEDDGGDFGEEGDDVPDDGEEMAEDEEEDEDPLERYRRGGKRTTPNRRKSARPTNAKIHYDSAHVGLIKAAADHLDDLAGMEADSKWSRTHAAACKYHSAGMRAMCKALEESDGAAGGNTVPEEPTANGEPQATEEEQKAAIMGIADAFAGVRKAVFDLTGRQTG